MMSDTWDDQVDTVSQTLENKRIEGEILKAQQKLAEAQLPGAIYEGQMDNMWYGKTMRTLGRLNPLAWAGLGGAVGLAGRGTAKGINELAKHNNFGKFLRSIDK